LFDSIAKNPIHSVQAILSPTIVRGDHFVTVEVDMTSLKRLCKTKIKMDDISVAEAQQQLLRLLEGKQRKERKKERKR
jgi:hypothetical protein